VPPNSEALHLERGADGPGNGNAAPDSVSKE
jgi:hypothetical protein